MKNTLVLIAVLSCIAFAKAQVGINTSSPSSQAILHIDAVNPDASIGGLRMPVVAEADLSNIPTNAQSEGLLVYVDTGSQVCLEVYNASTSSWDVINCLGATSDIFISEYVEGGSAGEKYVEIYNPTTSDVDLSNYSIGILRNGGTLPISGTDRQYTLSGTLGPGQTYILADNGAALFTAVDQTETQVDFGGNDPVVLLDASDNIIDVIGIPGTDPGAGYSVDGADTENVTLRRNPTILNPNSTWTPSEWSAYPVDTVNDLGSR